MSEQKVEQSYRLRCSLLGHSMDVRAVAVSSNGDIVTASRDKTARLWREAPGNCYEEKVVYEGHTGYVTSVCLIPGTDDYSDGFTATGSKDSSVLIFPRNESSILHTLTGHTDTVSCLTWKDNMLLSGSWDHSIRVWKNWECVEQLDGHSAPVWAVAVMEPNASTPLIISASADKTIKAWKDGKVLVTFEGHTDCVRGLSVVDSETFLSCSNDASIRLWNVCGDWVATYYGHASFIYSVMRMDPFTGFASGGEDRSVRVWSTLGEVMQTIYLPAQSVWTVAVLPNSDIVVGTSDGVCRVFSQCSNRNADPAQQRIFEESVSKFKVAVEDIGGVRKADLPDKTFLLTQGRRDGQTAMVREGDKVFCYSWAASKREWIAVGEVVGGTGGSAATSGKVLHEGREYDYVFDVDVDEGRVLKLPYNRGEDPWSVAQAFIHRHELPQDSLDQVANFIYKNAGVSSQSFGQSGYFDPFTGSSRYVPASGASGAPLNGVSGADPFTGSGRYVPTSSQQDSFSSPYFPQTVPLRFESVNKSGILNKLKECNQIVSEPLPEERLERLVEAVGGPSVVVADLEHLENALKWPAEKVWPALDVLRLALQSEEAQKRWIEGAKGNSIAALLVTFLGCTGAVATQLLSLRCLSNMAAHEPGRQALHSFSDSVLSSTLSLLPYANKNLEIAATSLLINYSIIFRNQNDITERRRLLTDAALVAHHLTDPEAKFRVLVAIGTILTQGNKGTSLITSNLKPLVRQFSLMTDPQKVSECARHVLRLL